MGGASKASQVLVRHVVDLMEILRAHKVLVGHYALDGSHHKLVLEPDAQLLEVVFEVRRWRDEHERVVAVGYLVDVTREEYLVNVKAHAHEIGRVVAQTAEIVDAVVAPHIPADVMSVPHHYLGDGRSPTAATDDCYFSAVKHFLISLMSGGRVERA